MLFKLTDKIWWGNWDSLHEVSFGGSILCLAANRELPSLSKASPHNLAEPILYFRHSRDDDKEVDAEYLHILDGIFNLVDCFDRYPLLVHCYAGQHRSPTTALYMALSEEGFNKENYARLFTRMHSLRPDIVYGPFSQSLDKEIRLRCGMAQLESYNSLNVVK